MLELMAALRIISDEDKNVWELPEVGLDYELIEWRVMEKCLGRIEVLNQDFNCFEKSSDVYDQNSCNANGKYMTFSLFI